jgi:putative tryptophan/tyrosine transport system substrate-binding protein
MNRREFITLLGGAAAAWPLAARAQQPAMPVIGFLHAGTPLADATYLVSGFRQGLNEAGYIQGQNVAVEYRSAEGSSDRLRSLVAEMISRPVSVIVGNSPAALAAEAATTRIPIVFATGADPIRDGFVTSINRPGGNVTGVTFLSELLGSKRLEMLRRLAPMATIAVLSYPDSSAPVAQRKEIEAAAQAIGQQLLVLDLSVDRDIERAFDTALQRGAGALLVGSGAFFNSNRQRIVTLAARHSLPALYPLREFVSAGGLMSYGTSVTDAYRQAGVYTGRILKGEKPADLPVQMPTKYELVVNLKTAKTLGLTVPDTLLARADEVIE